jgi:hypothetical protein
MKILIKVTKEVLERSKFCKSGQISTTTNCGIAVAVRDLFPNAEIQVYTANLLGEEFTSLNDLVGLPSEATHFIHLFDSLDAHSRVQMEPFSFEIEVPEFVIQTIGIGQIYKVLSESKTLEHVNPL